MKFIKSILFFIIILSTNITWAEVEKYSSVLRGNVVNVNEKSVQVMDRKGEILTITINDQTKVMGIFPSSLDQIKPGSFIGTGALSQPDGSLEALEVHLFAEELRGSGEGHYPWQSLEGVPGTMTNGTVGTLTEMDGHRLTVKHGDQQKQILVPPGTPVVSIKMAELNALTPGTHVVMFLVESPLKHMEVASVILAGNNGLTPPF